MCIRFETEPTGVIREYLTMGRQKNSRAFTLIELLVVVAIIAILVAILIPTLSRAYAGAHQVQCLSNLRQIGTAMEMYLQEYSSYPISVTGLPVSWHDYLNDPTIAQRTNLGYAVALLPYHKNLTIYNCPILSKLNCDVSYCYNWLLGNDGVAYAGGNMNTLTPGRVENPDRFVMIYDQPVKTAQTNGMYRDIDPSDEWGGADWNPTGQGALWYYNNAIAEGPHHGGHDILFADGHAKWFDKWAPARMTRTPN